MIETVTAATLPEYEAFISQHPKGHFLQSSMWGRLKKAWVFDALIARDQAGQIKGSIATLTRKVPGTPFTLMYSARGPVCDIHDAAVLGELTDGVRQLAKRRRAYILKMDPDVLASDEQFKGIMLGLGYRLLADSTNFEGVQPRFVFRQDIAGKTADQLMAIFSQKTRYNIRLAERKGVVVRLSGEEALPDFASLMAETGVRDHFLTRPEAYFRDLLRELGDHARLYMAYHDGVALAGTLAIHFGDKVWYLYGASANEHRNLMPNYLLQWTMMRWAVELGCRIYDFRGVSGDVSENNPLYGLYRFKKGFGGDFTEFVGEFNYVFNPVAYAVIERAIKAFRSGRDKVFQLTRWSAK